MLELKNVSFRVEDENTSLDIVDNVSLTLEGGKFLVITGPNGGGKSTLAKLIMGLEIPTGGQILFEGKDITRLPLHERANLGLGYAFQHPARFKGLTVAALLSLASGKDLPEDECCNYLTQVGLCSRDYLNREVDASLSGGELKRIEIATLLARDLKLSIFDEPEAGIDLWSFTMLVESFKNMHRRSDQSTIIISHQERIMQLADEVIIIANGKIRSRGEKKDMLPALMQEFGEICELDKTGKSIKHKPAANMFQ